MPPEALLRLRFARPGDAPRLARWRREDSIRRYQPLKELSVTDLKDELAGQRGEDLQHRRGEKFQWILEQDTTPVGWVTLVVQDWDHGLGEIGYSLGTAHQGRGLMVPMLRRFLAEIFHRTDLQRIEARCSVLNRASEKVLQAAGFTHEGTLRSYFLLDGRRHDNHLYSFLRSDLSEGGR